MKIFSEITGKPNQVYQDDIVELLIKCGNKRNGKRPKGLLAKILRKFNLSASNSYWDIKKKIWEVLRIQEQPVKIHQKERTILERNINNAAGIAILRNREGLLLLKALNLRQKIDKKTFQKVLFKKILNTKSKIKSKAMAIRQTSNIHKETKSRKIYNFEDSKALEGYFADKKYLYTKRNSAIVEKRKKQDRYTCKICDFQLKIKGKNIIECHHLIPFADKKLRLTNIKDLVSLCPTCHRIAHTCKPPLSVNELKKIRRK